MLLLKAKELKNLLVNSFTIFFLHNLEVLKAASTQNRMLYFLEASKVHVKQNFNFT